MSRPTKQGIDYFPLDCQFDNDMELLISEQGGISVSVLVTTWQLIYQNNGYYIVENDDLYLLIRKRLMIDIDIIKKIIKSAIKRDIFNKEKHKKHKILTSKGIQSRYIIASRLKKNINIVKKYLCIDVSNVKNYTYIKPNGVGNATKEEEEVNEEIEEKEYSANLKQFAVDFIEYVKKEAPSKSPTGKNVLSSSLDTLDKLIRLDGFEEEYIFKIIRWAKKDSFWQNQIYSLAGLRKKNDSGIMKFQSIIISYDKKASTEPKQKTREQLLKEYSHQ